MTPKEILEKAIQKAIDGWWDVFATECLQLTIFESTYKDREDKDNYYSDAPHDGLFLDVRRHGYYSVNDLIFNHDFAKALWGEKKLVVPAKTFVWRPDPKIFGGWQYHLQQMVIAEDPIKYLGENI